MLQQCSDHLTRNLSLRSRNLEMMLSSIFNFRSYLTSRFRIRSRKLYTKNASVALLSTSSDLKEIYFFTTYTNDILLLFILFFFVTSSFHPAGCLPHETCCTQQPSPQSSPGCEVKISLNDALYRLQSTAGHLVTSYAFMYVLFLRLWFYSRAIEC